MKNKEQYIICDEELDNYYNGDDETEESVAAGLGFNVDDEGNWVPMD
ncbi:hypothetical protein [Paenibacillus cremeus]|nr:hypothetical protein [Paenibacillus cremeus]